MPSRYTCDGTSVPPLEWPGDPRYYVATLAVRSKKVLPPPSRSDRLDSQPRPALLRLHDIDDLAVERVAAVDVETNGSVWET